MLKSIGSKKTNMAIFISETGSNLKNLIIHSLQKNSRFRISLVISNNPKAKGLNHTKKFGISGIFRGQGVGICKAVISLSTFHQCRLWCTEYLKTRNQRLGYF